ncbi:hypothetical protein U9M48_032655 [Paspalum notatum var. saurae]|uniref:Protein FAR1-RELATED SEQUENCE n=1 Tax=Paspalum notatum var. saurae TaxID=547442 RepID=A0AAQ3U8C6_PASNO
MARMTPAEPASPSECYASGDDVSPDEKRLSLETDASSAEAGDGDPDPVPYVGQRFPTHDAAYGFYSEFARRCGFSIRRHRTGLTRRYFVCHRAGSAPAPAKPLAGAPRPQRNRSSSRCGCQAYMRIGRAAGPLAEWRVTGFSSHHDRALLRQDKVRFLPAYRVISGADRDRILMFAKSGISVQQMVRIMELEKCIEPGNLPFTEKDVRNLMQVLEEVCARISKTRIPVSSTNSPKMQTIVCRALPVFDTIHRLSALDMVLGIWVGLDNYGTPCFFACVLLREESFAWAFQTILTDQNVCLKEAIEKELPSTKHALCIWLIAGRFTSWFGANLGDRYND